MKAVGDNPNSRYPADTLVTESKGIWWVAKVKPRMEKALATDFTRLAIDYYLPLCTKVTRRKDNNKPRKSVLPLFAGYIAFACVDAPKNIFSTGRVVNLVEVRHQKHFVQQLLQIQQALEGGLYLEPCSEDISAGMAVRVTRGPLTGIEGLVVTVKGTKKLVLSVEALGRAALTIDTALVVPV